MPEAPHQTFNQAVVDASHSLANALTIEDGANVASMSALTINRLEEMSSITEERAFNLSSLGDVNLSRFSNYTRYQRAAGAVAENTRASGSGQSGSQQGPRGGFR